MGTEYAKGFTPPGVCPAALELAATAHTLPGDSSGFHGSTRPLTHTDVHIGTSSLPEVLRLSNGVSSPSEANQGCEQHRTESPASCCQETQGLKGKIS